jgi:hypothetical protein
MDKKTEFLERIGAKLTRDNGTKVEAELIAIAMQAAEMGYDTGFVDGVIAGQSNAFKVQQMMMGAMGL